MSWVRYQDIFGIDTAIVFEDGAARCGCCGARFPGSIEQIVMGIHAGLECLRCGAILAWIVQNPLGLDFEKGEAACLRCGGVFVPAIRSTLYCSKKCARLDGKRLL